MRRIAAAVCAVVLFGTARAADLEPWFTGGIGENWPADETMSGGSWMAGAESRAKMSGGALQISMDEDDSIPLTFDATFPKSLGDDASATSVLTAFRCAFEMFSSSALPEVPESIKGAVILVTDDPEPDEALEGTLYYAAYDATRGANGWVNSGVSATTSQFVSFDIRLSRGSSGFLAVHYNIEGWTADVSLKQADTVVHGAAYYGIGQTDTLTSKFEPGASVSLNVTPITGLVATNVTANGVSIATECGSYLVAAGSSVVVYYAAAAGYRLLDDGVLTVGTVTEDTTVDQDTPGVPLVEATGKYRIGSWIYTSFAAMVAELEDGDVVTMLTDDTLPAGAALFRDVTFDAGDCVLSTASGECLAIAADVAFVAGSASRLPLTFQVACDCTLTLPDGTELGDYALQGEDYARAVLDGEAWVCRDGQWRKSDRVTMNFYYPGYFESEAWSADGSYAALVEDGSVDAFVDYISDNDCAQRYYWDEETGVLIDYVYWFDGTWSDNPQGIGSVDVPTRYVAGDFYPNSTAIVYRITYAMGGVSGAVNTNRTDYSIETEKFDLFDASAPGYEFLGWEDDGGRRVTAIDPVALGAEFGCLYDVSLHATWRVVPALSSSAAPKATRIAPQTPTAYDTPEAASAAAAALNSDLAASIRVPEGFSGDVSAYAENFTAVADGTTVEIVLTDAAKAKLVAALNSSVRSVAEDLSNPDVARVTIVGAEPGFYYSIVGGTSPVAMTAEGVRALAQESAVELEKPDLGETGMSFYLIKAAVR